jgi:hypothetical protein
MATPFCVLVLITAVPWNPHPPTPSPAGEGEQNPYYFLVPLSYGRGARGEGFTAFHVTPVIKKNKVAARSSATLFCDLFSLTFALL